MADLVVQPILRLLCLEKGGQAGKSYLKGLH
jgi:hypothetical protein